MFRTCNMFALHNFLKTNYFLSSNWSSSMLATSSIRFLSFQEFSRSLHHQDTFRVLLRWYILGVAAWVRHLVGKCRPGISSNILQVGLVPSLDSKIKNYSDSVKIKIYLHNFYWSYQTVHLNDLLVHNPLWKDRLELDWLEAGCDHIWFLQICFIISTLFSPVINSCLHCFASFKVPTIFTSSIINVFRINLILINNVFNFRPPSLPQINAIPVINYEKCWLILKQ